MVNASPNTILWRFFDATVPQSWRSKQAKRFFDAAMEQEQKGEWAKSAVGGSVRIATHRTSIPALPEPSFGYRTPDASIESQIKSHIRNLRAQADRLEGTLHCYGPGAFRTNRVAIRAPMHPFNAEQEILSILSRDDVDEVWVHGRHFVRDSSRAFVEKTE